MRRKGCDRRAFVQQTGAALGLAGFLRGSLKATAGDLAGDDVKATLALRKQELLRRVAGLNAELKVWRGRVRTAPGMNLHFSQIAALDTLMQSLLQPLQGLVDVLNANGPVDDFLSQALRVSGEIFRAQGVWDYYREKLQQRFSPDFEATLTVADVVAWDCYRPVLENAAALKILPKADLREPPLCYYIAGFSPYTWVRGTEPSDLRDLQGGTVRTPIPVIALPWDHAQNLWEFLSIPHEVGHDLEADLKLRTSLLASLDSALRQEKIPQDRADVWKGWLAETFADLVALQLVGPAFADMLMHLLLLPPESVTTFNPLDSHPTHYIRILMNAAYIRGLVGGDEQNAAPQRRLNAEHADRIERTWKGLYGEPAGLRGYAEDFSVIFKALMDTPLQELKDRTVRNLVPFTADDFKQIRDAAEDLQRNRNPAPLRPRYAIAAARLAVTGVMGQDGLPAKLKQINEITASLVKVPRGFLGPAEGNEHDKFIASFAKTISVNGPGQRRSR